MGTGARQKPQRLGEKLLQIRQALGLSQSEMVRHLGLEDIIWDSKISHYELGKREPTLLILLNYARAGGVHMEALVDDKLDLPDKIPGKVRRGEIERLYSKKQ